MLNSEDILTFWLDETEPKNWYVSSAAFDQKIRDFALEAWQNAMAGKCDHKVTTAREALAYIILMDQFSRNMFRDTGQAFASDGKAMAAAKMAIERKWDLQISEPARQFFYLPLMHSECLVDQDRCVRLFKDRMPDSDSNMLHAKAHREVIRKFGRFPYRNAALGRATTAAEAKFLEDGGYRVAVESVSA